MLRKSNSSGNYLDNLQRDSWQLELLVTGFALAGMLSGVDEFDSFTDRLKDILRGHPNVFGAEVFIILLIDFAFYVTLMHFFVHVVIRCLWIGAIGLRSVMGPTDYETLDLAPTFKKFILRRNGSFDNYIRNLDKLASVIFAVTFLLIAIMVSTYLSIVIISLLFIGLLSLGDGPLVVISGFIMIMVFLLLMLAYLLDFLSAGVAKKNENIARLYYPVYRVFGWLTLARLYRPFYYNLVSHPLGKKIVYFLIPYLIITLMIFGFRLQPNTFFDHRQSEYSDEDRQNIMFSYSYADEQHPDDRNSFIILPSRQLSGPVVEVRIPVQPRLESLVVDHCPDLVPINSYSFTIGGLESFVIGFSLGARQDSLGRVPESMKTRIQEEIIPCLLAPLELKLDDEEVALDQCFVRPPKKGELFTELITFISLRDLSEGTHSFTLNQYEASEDDDKEREKLKRTTVVPFYYVDDRLDLMPAPADQSEEENLR
ncbi:hypothetical protein [Lewinella sp. W8]|uniref:hypothetical protein n=1 Tax=Lewinella sp. W8 TaxID=2528208 RepID=UPI00106761BB|nr:hypothetical protein [Lewinella sp. W8]MTB52246.1 hypothetical protein [Lewinella sp. W8]